MSKLLTTLTAALALTTAIGTVAIAADGIATGDTSKKVIALANNYAGNSWRQAMLRDWDAVAKQAVDEKLVKEAPSFTTAENSVTEQAQLIQNLILQGVDAIVLDAASPTALNGAVKEACNAGIVVVSFDQVVTEDCAYRIATDNTSMGVIEVNYLADRLDGKGNLLEVRGLAGGAIDADIHKGVMETIKKYPNMKILGEVHGNVTQTVAQKEVSGILPTLPKIDGVITQGGDGYGTALAFQNAGRDLPIIIMGNRYDEVTYWQKQRDKDGYETMSISSAPGMVQMAFWVAQQALAGKDIPKEITIPLLELHQPDLDYWVAHTPKGGVTTASYPLDWTVQAIDAINAGQPLPDVPLVD